MRGFPKHFATKQDYLNVLEEYPEKAKTALASLYADRFVWKREKDLEEGDDGVSDIDHMIQEEGAGDGERKRVQYHRVEDSNARYVRLGFTKKEILSLIS